MRLLLLALILPQTSPEGAAPSHYPKYGITDIGFMYGSMPASRSSLGKDEKEERIGQMVREASP